MGRTLTHLSVVCCAGGLQPRATVLFVDFDKKNVAKGVTFLQVRQPSHYTRLRGNHSDTLNLVGKE